MDETKVVFILIVVGIIIFVIFEIYDSVKRNQEQIKEQELKKQREEQEQIKNIERRKKKSYKWIMKKIYKEPKIKVVRVRHHQMLCTSPTDPDVEHLDIIEDEEDIRPLI